ncbi:MAG: 1-acyl-sn-glycerol-3-phosphate acyltransferase [Chlorobium sp.]|jgi:1-acyl-sn-glycerol-3-phosphate acyltransferase|uniref:lysophospholipid acyltransferase family protein n=1 Tax=Chlorobium sp. TaxID=1095 RepID=UPI001D8D54A6|nr:lysophospholipid acyltransferase family protein [Chlorobium sp.]MBN1279292.1 1-acyl-sn-glycerol-3-phosphate acyltransferase [Chlorobiaceae bacterium]MCF8216694.1 1-acyl-sn-glycerol-3-phosphate acyltransferase [Chlorobium sp.]MCF8270845.1 1-acyl-sn-glycerol-3-phosphate acyltransferase [Chlorobium sp.]MCF8287221.1 1-acyl-sn-glycerol-3-phosphate acyltransferase [Chlorobium sp.]MCF8290879.1 1-acyl-sn-glycerol-3-phosphate acyltransferase [Chlorobium sp.]
MSLRTLLFFFILIPVMFVGMSIALVVSLFEHTGDFFSRMAAWWGRFAARIFGIDIEVTGEENYHAGESYLVVSNHAGMADIPLILGAMKLNLRFVAKEELGRIPVFGWALKRSGYVMIKRGQNREALKSLLAAADVLRSGRSVHIFPEGTRSETGKLLPFKRGAFLVAKKGGSPLLPVTIIGSNLITPKKSLRISKGRVRMIIGEPIDPARYTSVEELQQAAHQIISANLDKYSKAS